MVRAAGAAQVHVRISSPPTTHPCFYGIDTPSRDHLLAASRGVAEIGEFIGADSVGYLDLSDLQAAMGDADGGGFCYACFTGRYPVPPPGPRP
jgi:amidophosphoribosyltransferase